MREYYNTRCWIRFSVILFILFAFNLTGCDFSARWDLKRAEKALQTADKVNAERWAEREYRKAQESLGRALDFTAENKINEARDEAQDALEWAEEAIELSIRRRAELEEELDGLKSKKF